MTARRNLPLLIAALWIAEVTGSFETAMILAALKRLIEDFGNPAMVGWLITGYLIVGAAIAAVVGRLGDLFGRSEEHTSELQSLMRISYAVFCLKKKYRPHQQRIACGVAHIAQTVLRRSECI